MQVCSECRSEACLEAGGSLCSTSHKPRQPFTKMLRRPPLNTMVKYTLRK